MMKRYKDILLSFSMIIFVLLSAVFVTVFISDFLFKGMIERYHLETITGLSYDQLVEEYAHLKNYLWLFNRKALELSYFPMSTYGRIHFEDVKGLVDGLQIIWVLSGVLSLGIGMRFIRTRRYDFLKMTAAGSVVLPLTIGALASLNFSQAFIIFHEFVFSNDYWIFDIHLDPVILMLPEAFFMKCFFVICGIIVLLSMLCLYVYHLCGKKELALS